MVWVHAFRERRLGGPHGRLEQACEIKGFERLYSDSVGIFSDKITLFLPAKKQSARRVESNRPRLAAKRAMPSSDRNGTVRIEQHEFAICYFSYDRPMRATAT
jgi:hypothetical protein